MKKTQEHMVVNYKILVNYLNHSMVIFKLTTMKSLHVINLFTSFVGRWIGGVGLGGVGSAAARGSGAHLVCVCAAAVARRHRAARHVRWHHGTAAGTVATARAERAAAVARDGSCG